MAIVEPGTDPPGPPSSQALTIGWLAAAAVAAVVVPLVIGAVLAAVV